MKLFIAVLFFFLSFVLILFYQQWQPVKPSRSVLVGPSPVAAMPAISGEELSRGWYWGDELQKKPGTPADWVFTAAGRSSCWRKQGKDCSIDGTNNLVLLCQQAGGTWLNAFNECEGLELDASFCQKNKGVFFECLSACRHESPELICNTACMQVCQF